VSRQMFANLLKKDFFYFSSKCCPTYDGMVSCGITRRFPISLHRLFLRFTNLRKPLKPACTIPCVVRWPLLFLNLFVSFLSNCFSAVHVLGREGLKGSLAKFDSSVGFVRFANVPCSAGMVNFDILFISKYIKFFKPVIN